MEVKRFTHARHFLDEVEGFLIQEEQLNNLMLGLLYRIKEQAVNPNDLFLTVSDQQKQLIILMSGLYLILYANSTDQMLYHTALNYLEEQKIDYPGVIGPVAICDAFKSAYENKTNEKLVQGMSQRIFMIKEVKSRSDIQGELVLASKEHYTFLVDWLYNFAIIAHEKPTIESTIKSLDNLIEKKALYVLSVGEKIVSMAAGIRPFLSGISVGCVYTPDQYRNKGYATKCVELLTEKLLMTHEYCTLYTDLSNPTSNSIYQKIGYRPVGDSVVYVKA